MTILPFPRPRRDEICLAGATYTVVTDHDAPLVLRRSKTPHVWRVVREPLASAVLAGLRQEVVRP